MLYSIPLLLFRLKRVLDNPEESLIIAAKNIARSSLFITVDTTLFKYAMCLLRNWDHRPPPIAHYIVALSSVLGSLGFFVEQPSRRVELLYYVLPQVFYALWKILSFAKPLRVDKIPLTSVWLFSLSLMMVMYSHTHQQEAIAPFINRSLGFLLKD